MGVPFHCTAYDQSRSNWEGFRNHLRDVPWENILKVGASAAVTEFLGVRLGWMMYISLIVNIKLSRIDLYGFQLLALLP